MKNQKVGIIMNVDSDKSTLAPIISLLNECQTVEPCILPIKYIKREDVDIPLPTKPFRGKVRRRRRY